MAALTTLDLVIIGAYVVFALGVGSLFFKEAGEGMQSFFVGDRKLPWYIAGTSIVATTFAADTPLAVAGIVANDGISGNWIWWCWALAHLSATFFFARLWRRSGVITDAEITEVRYSGKPAAGLRAFKALYFGIFINCLVMAWVISAMVKISGAFFPEIEEWKVIAYCILVSVGYTTMGGFRGVVITDVVQFTLGMIGAVLVAVYALEPFGGIGATSGGDGADKASDAVGSGLLGRLEATAQAAGTEVGHILDFMPGTDHPTITPLYFFVLLFAGWWRYAEGSGYVVQRLAACRDEGQAQGASLWFTVAHNALRPWPWIIVGLVGLVTFPQLGAPTEQLTATVTTAAGEQQVTVRPAHLDVARGGEIELLGLTADGKVVLAGQEAPLVALPDNSGSRASLPPFNQGGVFDLSYVPPSGTPTIIGAVQLRLDDREMAYPLVMRKVLPAGLLGLVIASLLAAFMSTIDTHTNWGASYLVNDIYRRFFAPDKDEKHYAMVSRLLIVVIAILAGLAATFIGSIAAVWRFLIALGAGLGSVSAARWYWSRVTPQAEFAAIGVTTVLAIGLELFCTTTLFGSDNPLFVVAVPAWAKILRIAFASLATWIPVALLGPKNDEATLQAFYDKVTPAGPGWARFASSRTSPDHPGHAALRFVGGVIVTFGTLYGIGEVVIGSTAVGAACLVVAVVVLALIIKSGKGQEV